MSLRAAAVLLALVALLAARRGFQLRRPRLERVNRSACARSA